MTPTPKMTWEEALEYVLSMQGEPCYEPACEICNVCAVLRAANLQPRDLVLEEAAKVCEKKWAQQIDTEVAELCADKIRALKKGE